MLLVISEGEGTAIAIGGSDYQVKEPVLNEVNEIWKPRMPYPVIEIQDYEQIETLGTKKKHWYRGPQGVRCLFKQGRPGTGENWSEKITCELAKLMKIPCARYELARWKGCCGVMAPSFVPERGRLVLGNEVLTRVIPGYDPDETYRARKYRLSTICDLLEKDRIKPPLDCETSVAAMGPLQVFIGYLVFDCWIGNPDRHHENWGFVVTPNAKVHLAPTFDHASGLGVRLSNEQRRERLATKDRGFSLKLYVTKARTPFHDVSGSKMFTLQVVQELVRLDPQSVKFWLDQLGKVTPKQIAAIFEAMPTGYLTPIEVEFAMRMLDENKSRMEPFR